MNPHKNDRACLSDYCCATAPLPFFLSFLRLRECVCSHECECVRVIVLSAVSPLRGDSRSHFRISDFLNAPRPSDAQTQACERADDAEALEAGGGRWRKGEQVRTREEEEQEGGQRHGRQTMKLAAE